MNLKVTALGMGHELAEWEWRTRQTAVAGCRRRSEQFWQSMTLEPWSYIKLVAIKMFSFRK
ncbi:protein of unknown function [Methanoculleus bourgensis]|uniref:Uncharacterized protein n=1 Tax=Methanoculleus bourgensis TaxID=83986 RepID=A0A0X3BH92_9EURY|nr:protein of unknown function [Methanoculleus bourgensis]